jgi:peptidyl-prolyl cis-trans isomerase C
MFKPNSLEEFMKKTLLTLSIVAVTFTCASAADKILAKVNGKPITESQIKEVLDRLPANYNSVKNNPQFRDQILNTLINQELLYQEAEKEKIEKDKKVQKQIEEAKKQIVINALLEKHLKPKDVKVTDEEAKVFYERNKAQFTDTNGKQIPFDTVKPFIVQTLQQQKRKEAFMTAFNKYIDELKKKNKVEIVK